VPNADANGADSFTYRARDAAAASAPATVSVTIQPVNDAPVCGSRTLATDEDTPASVSPTCTDVDGDALTYEIAGQGTKGTASVVSGELRYVPNADASGADSFSYRARDAAAASAPAGVDVTIRPANDAPVCLSRSLMTDEETPGTVAPSCSDAEGGALTYEIAGQGTKGTASVVSGELRYVPNADANGADSFTYRARDAAAASVPATVSVTIRPVNDVPEALAQNVATPENTAKTVTLAGDDPDGDALRFTIVSLPADGTLHDGSSAAGPPITAGALPYLLSGSQVTYKPNTGFFGSDGFDFKARDTSAESTAATVAITVQGVNTAPVCLNKAFSVEEDGDISDQVCTDDGAAMTFVHTGPSHGDLDLFEDGWFSYRPDPDYDGPDSFTVTATDEEGLKSATATVTLTVTPANDAPVCDDVELETNENTPGETDPFCFDIDGDELTYAIVAQGSKGTASVTAGGRLRYVPNADALGSDTFTYRASDGAATSTTVNAAVTIVAVNERPVCYELALWTAEDTAGTTFTDCEDPDGDPLTYSIATQGTKGTASVVGDRLRYVPNPNENGSDEFTYRASDGALQSLEATILVTITERNDAPVAADDFEATVPEDSTTGVAVQVLLNDTDGPANEASQSLEVSPFLVEEPQHGIASVGTSGADNNRIRYFPDEGYNGPDTMVYEVCDDGTTDSEPDPRCTTARVSVTVVDVVGATVETDPVAHGGDAADDAAIWVHPTDPALSTIIGTDKLGGLAVYDLSGAQLQLLDPARRMNNVDL
ncbi:MAG TPA: phytase, partial [Actinomycetota bacterium]|nr:phytase [Actinomycetota bacterium]